VIPDAANLVVFVLGALVTVYAGLGVATAFAGSGDDT